MSDMMQTGFDYGALPVEVGISGRIIGERLRTRLKRTVQDIIESGKDLISIKPNLEGCFDAWFEHETGLDRHMAYKFMQVSEKFGTVNNLPSTLSPTILYALSAPSTPESVIEKALEKAESGDKVTVADVKQWKEAAQAASQRAEEFREESNARRKKIRELEQQVDLLKSEKPEPEVRIEAPADYEAIKERAEKMAERIQARAIRRCGELLKQIEPATGAHWENKRDGTDTLTRTEAATQAGLSERQKVMALRVANTECSRACPPSMLYARLIRTSASTSTCPPSIFPPPLVQQEPAVRASSEPSRAVGYPPRQMSRVSGLSIFQNCCGCLDRSSKASRRAWTVSSVIHRAWQCTSRCSSRCYANT